MSKLAKALGVHMCNGCGYEFTPYDMKKIKQWFQPGYLREDIELIWCNGPGTLIHGWYRDKQGHISWKNYHIAMTREEYEQVS